MLSKVTEYPFQLPILTSWRKAQLLRYAKQVLTAQHQMQTDSGKNIIHYTLKEQPKHIHMQHYPKGDRIDKSTGGQYFYHCHRENYESTEHGHFHCFLRYDNIPKRTKPTPLADWEKNLDNPMTHLIAISMDQLGQPIRLFTVNRWVTDETWYDAKHVMRFINRFKMTLSDNLHWQILDKWVEGILHLFAPQIVWLHQKRDQVIKLHQQHNPNDNVYEDHTMEELSEIGICLKQQIQWLINTATE
jgi:hypothetical protein